MPFPFPKGQLFEIHCSKLKLDPICDLSQTSVLRAALPVGTVLTDVRFAPILPVAFAVCGGVVQRFVRRTDDLIVEFVVDVFVPRQIAAFDFRTGICRGQDTTAFEDTLADPRGFVGAVSNNDFVFRVSLAEFVIQRVKSYAVVYISRRNMDSHNEVISYAADAFIFVLKEELNFCTRQQTALVYRTRGWFSLCNLCCCRIIVLKKRI